MTIPDYLLIGIKDGKIEILGQGGDENMITLAKKKKKKSPNAFDKMILVVGNELNI